MLLDLNLPRKDRGRRLWDGYASLSLLKLLPVDVIKVDRSFVGGLGRDGDDTAIVSTVMSLAGHLGLTVIAEGVETAEQLADLRAMGCRLGQGFFFERPLPVEEVADLLQAPTSLTSWVVSA